MIILYFFDRSTNKFEKDLLKIGKFAIGTFNGYSFSPGTRGSDRSFQYYFYDSDGKYHNGGFTLKGKYPDKAKKNLI